MPEEQLREALEHAAGQGCSVRMHSWDDDCLASWPNSPRWWCASCTCRAALAAVPSDRRLSEDEVEAYEDHVRSLRDWCEAYPVDVFPVPPEDKRAMDSAAADVMRSMALPQFARDADAIEALLDRLAPPGPICRDCPLRPPTPTSEES